MRFGFADHGLSYLDNGLLAQGMVKVYLAKAQQV